MILYLLQLPPLHLCRRVERGRREYRWAGGAGASGMIGRGGVLGFAGTDASQTASDRILGSPGQSWLELFPSDLAIPIVFSWGYPMTLGVKFLTLVFT